MQSLLKKVFLFHFFIGLFAILAHLLVSAAE